VAWTSAVLWIGQACHGGDMASRTARHVGRAFDGLCDDEAVPLICPTCQELAQASLPASAGYFAWGCFRYFWLGTTAMRTVARILLEAAHAGEAFAVVEWRARRVSNS